MVDILAFPPFSLTPRMAAIAFAAALSVGVLAHAEAETVNLERRLQSQTNVAFWVAIDYSAQLVDMLYVNRPNYHDRGRARISDTQIYWQIEDISYPVEYFLNIYSGELRKKIP